LLSFQAFFFLILRIFLLFLYFIIIFKIFIYSFIGLDSKQYRRRYQPTANDGTVLGSHQDVATCVQGDDGENAAAQLPGHHFTSCEGFTFECAACKTLNIVRGVLAPGAKVLRWSKNKKKILKISP
jgi:hypothetical protein